jgi:hypothetical protein
MVNLMESLCEYPRNRFFDGVSSEIIMDIIKDESSVLDPLDDILKSQLQEYVSIQLLKDLSPENGIDLSNALTTVLCTHVCLKSKLLYCKEGCQSTISSEKICP